MTFLLQNNIVVFYYFTTLITIIFSVYKINLSVYYLELFQENLVHPGITIVEYLKEIGFKKKAYCIATSMFLELLVAGGIDCYTAVREIKIYITGNKYFLNNERQRVVREIIN